MNIFRKIWNNIVLSALGAILVALVSLITHGEHLGQATNAWFLFFFIVYTVGDVILWAVSKYRGNV